MGDPQIMLDGFISHLKCHRGKSMTHKKEEYMYLRCSILINLMRITYKAQTYSLTWFNKQLN